MCQVRQPTDSVKPMIRPTFSATDEQKKVLSAAVAATHEADEKVAAGWAAILAAREAGIPDTLICERTGWSRATLNRRFGPRKTDE